MKNFKKASKPKSAYKDTKAWLNSVYRNNKEVIDEKLSGYGRSPKTLFKMLIEEQIKQDKNTPTQALKTIARSRIFTSKQEHYAQNAWSGITEDPRAYKRFRELTKEKGKYTPFDPNKLIWNSMDKVYVYNGDIIVSFQNSPKGILVYKYTKVGP